MNITANRLGPSSSTENIVLVSLELLLFKTLLWCSCSAHRLQSKRPSKPGVGPMPPLAPDSGAIRMSASQYYRSKARYLPGIGKSPHQTVDPSKQQLTDAGTPHCFSLPQFLGASLSLAVLYVRNTTHLLHYCTTLVIVLSNRDSATVCGTLCSDRKWEGCGGSEEGERWCTQALWWHALRRAARRGAVSCGPRTPACWTRTARDGPVRALEARPRARLALLALVSRSSQRDRHAQENMCALSEI